jgi:hypothetical protein
VVVEEYDRTEFALPNIVIAPTGRLILVLSIRARRRDKPVPVA